VKVVEQSGSHFCVWAVLSTLSVNSYIYGVPKLCVCVLESASTPTTFTKESQTTASTTSGATGPSTSFTTPTVSTVSTVTTTPATATTGIFVLPSQNCFCLM